VCAPVEMSSSLRFFKEPTNVRRQFTVHPYVGFIGDTNTYYFTVRDNKLYRIEYDLSGVQWVTARDMGKQVVVSEIDPEIIEYWETRNAWENIRVARPGIARKFQVVNMDRGNYYVSWDDNNGPAWNAGAYLPNQKTTAIYNCETDAPNDMLVLGRAASTVSTDYFENLPFGTFYAMNDPVVIQYEFSDVTYTRAIKNRIDETTLF
jgi:hypothetical protein